MTKSYLGNGTYELYLSSGKSLVLTEAEIDEIVEDSRTHSSGTIIYGNRKKNRRTYLKLKRVS